MLEFQQPTKDYSDVFLEDTDKPLPEKLNPHTRYAFFSTIAKGGKSLIKSCKDLHLNRVICYKTLRPEFVQDEIEQRRLLREARVSAMLQHPNTIPTYEVGRDNQGNYYFTMKLVHGYTLREILNYRDRYDLTQLIDIIVQIAQALAYAHSHGVAHRDIKPENILVGPFGEVLLLDWGLAKVWSKDGQVVDDFEKQQPKDPARVTEKGMTGQGQLQGTLCYMSPEQIRRDPEISFATDTYSLGSVLYEVLSGKTPFDGDKAYEVLEAIEKNNPEAPSLVGKYPVPRQLETICMQCLAKSPEQRPENMQSVIDVLRQRSWESDLIKKS